MMKRRVSRLVSSAPEHTKVNWYRRCFTVWGMLIVLLSCLAGCDGSNGSDGSVPDCEAEPRFELLGDQEAELMAMCLAREFSAPDELYGQVLGDLAAIRSTFGEEVPIITQIGFTPPCEPSAVLVGFEKIARIGRSWTRMFGAPLVVEAAQLYQGRVG